MYNEDGDNMKTCLVLEGGALRGIYTAGVLDTLQKENIVVDTIIGVSMGSICGINYVSNQIGRTLRYNLKYCKDKNYMSYHNLIKTGDIVNNHFAYDTIPNQLDLFDYDAYKCRKTKFLCTVTNIETGEAEYIEIKDPKKEIDYIKAGASMPVVSSIVEIDNKKYLDGGIADSIPVKKAISLGYDKIIVVLTRPITYRKRKSKNKTLQRPYKEYPNLQKALEVRNENYNKTVEEIIKLEEEGKILVIRPTRKVKIKRIEHNPTRIQEQYDLGVEDCKAKIKEVKKYLKI